MNTFHKPVEAGSNKTPKGRLLENADVKKLKDSIQVDLKSPRKVAGVEV